MRKNFYYCRIYFSFAVLLFGCTSKKKIIYFQGEIGNIEVNKNYNPVFHTDDLLAINVIGMDPETVKPFNLPVLSTNMAAGGYSAGTPTPPGYLIDSDGNIDFPLLGKIKAAGLPRNALVDTLKTRLKPYLTNPALIIRILNFKVTVLGEVHNPGSFTIPNERVTLPEALGIAGDLMITARRKSIIVIRDTDGKKTKYTIDLTSKDIFSSPVYYLNQNDVVYVEPNRSKINSSSINQTNAALIISATSIIITLFVLFRTH